MTHTNSTKEDTMIDLTTFRVRFSMADFDRAASRRNRFADLLWVCFGTRPWLNMPNAGV